MSFDTRRSKLITALDTLFYDGDCGLCHRAVTFLLARDRQARFRFAPLGGELFQSSVPESARATLPDTLVVKTADGRLLIKSTAVFYMLDQLGGLWPLVANVGRLFPRPLRDWVYDLVAHVRRRLFARPRSVCPIVPRELRDRFAP